MFFFEVDENNLSVFKKSREPMSRSEQKSTAPSKSLEKQDCVIS